MYRTRLILDLFILALFLSLFTSSGWGEVTVITKPSPSPPGPPSFERSREQTDRVEVKVKGLIIDVATQTPVVILGDLAEEKYLPIWIGAFEANAILLKLKGIPTTRPMTHDLIKSLLDALKARVVRIIIQDLKENTYYASMSLECGEIKADVDARPSDAIALALRMNVPIYISQTIILKAKFLDKMRYEEEMEKFKKWLQETKPENL